MPARKPAITKLVYSHTEYQVRVAWRAKMGVRRVLHQTIECANITKQRRVVKEWEARRANPEDGLDITSITKSERDVFVSEWTEEETG